MALTAQNHESLHQRTDADGGSEKERIERRERKREHPETSRAHNRTGKERESDYSLLRRIETA